MFRNSSSYTNVPNSFMSNDVRSLCRVGVGLRVGLVMMKGEEGKFEMPTTVVILAADLGAVRLVAVAMVPPVVAIVDLMVRVVMVRPRVRAGRVVILPGLVAFVGLVATVVLRGIVGSRLTGSNWLVPVKD